jgi:adenosine deaminase
MLRRRSSIRMFMTSVRALALVLSCAMALTAPSTGPHTARAASAQDSSEQKAARYFETIRKSPSQLWKFLLTMPKGGDLHNHVSGSIYAESYIQWAAENGLCVNNKSLALTVPPTKSSCAANEIPAATALTNSVFFHQLVDAWSMRNWELSGDTGRDHFFNAFGKFGAATYGQTGRMIAEAATRAAHGQVLYLELMLTPDGVPDGVASVKIGQAVGWDGNAESTLAKLKANGIANAAVTAIANLKVAEAQKNQLLKCDTPQADPGCTVTIRYIAQVSRAGSSLGAVFAQMVTGFALASDPSSTVVGLNLVQGEDSPASMQNFSTQMQMLKSLRSLYPQAHSTLHAGELVPGLVPPEGLTFHIRESVMTARAERIGHGVDIMHEKRPDELLKEMARRNVLVEICLSSNDLILGISGAQHPLTTYLKYGVPVALATDDEGVSRSEISREFLRAVQDQGLGYVQLKVMARNSLQYAFIAGRSLWNDGDRDGRDRRFTPVAQCAPDIAAMKLASSGCRDYLASNEKAKLQWQLEEDLKAFEGAY